MKEKERKIEKIYTHNYNTDPLYIPEILMPIHFSPCKVGKGSYRVIFRKLLHKQYNVQAVKITS